MKKEKPTITYYDENGKEIAKKLNVINNRKLISKIKKIVSNSYYEQFFCLKNDSFTNNFTRKIISFGQMKIEELSIENNSLMAKKEIIIGNTIYKKCSIGTVTSLQDKKNKLTRITPKCNNRIKKLERKLKSNSILFYNLLKRKKNNAKIFC